MSSHTSWKTRSGRPWSWSLAWSVAGRIPALVLLLASLAPPTAPLAAQEQSCRVIVHPANPALQIKREAIVAIYKGQMTRWKDGSAILPVDQSARSPVRAAFTTKVLGETVLGIQTHWQRQIASGRGVPPPVKPSDAEVVGYVKSSPAAIGYVSEGFSLDNSVKVVTIVE